MSGSQGCPEVGDFLVVASARTVLLTSSTEGADGVLGERSVVSLGPGGRRLDWLPVDKPPRTDLDRVAVACRQDLSSKIAVYHRGMSGSPVIVRCWRLPSYDRCDGEGCGS